MKIFHEGDELSAHTVAEFWNEVADTTIDELGANKALKIDQVHTQNWIDIADWLTKEHDVESLENDIMMLYFSSLYSGLLWLNVYFLTGNYLAMHRSLRYHLEGISQAYHIHQQEGNKELGLDDHLDWLITEIERENPPVKNKIILPVLHDVLDDDKEEIEEWFLGDDGFGLWDKLCKSVHPSGIDIAHRISRSSNMIYWNQFNKEEAEDAISATNAVFDVINVVMLKTYPAIHERAIESPEFPRSEDLYYTKKYLKRFCSDERP